MGLPDQVIRHYCESCRARYGLPEAIGAPFGGFITATCEFCRRERECHVVEERARLQPASEESVNLIVLDQEGREDSMRGSEVNLWWVSRVRLAAKR